MKTHTCKYEIGFDNEMSVDGKTYYCKIDWDVEFDSESEAQSVEVLKCEIQQEDGNNLPCVKIGERYEKIAVVHNPALTEAIDQELWKRVQQFAEDNSREILYAVDEDCEMAKAEWFRE